MAFNFNFRLNLDTTDFVNGLRGATDRLTKWAQKTKEQSIDTLMPKGKAWTDIINTADLGRNYTGTIPKEVREARKQVSGMRGLIEKNLLEPAKKSAVQFKDVARIVQGIIISKIFYTSLNAIRNATSAVFDFTNQLENAQVAYTQLFGNANLASELLVVLKEFAAITPFSFKESEAAARQLLAYGIQMKNVMYVMQGVMSASALTGNPEAVDRIARALGQIQTKGRLAAEEVRQLAEAGVPAYQILREELGLTAEDMQNIGKAGIPASKAINALVDGMNKRFGGGVEALAQTTTGLLNKIGDNLLQLGTRVFQPLMQWFKGILQYVGLFVARIRSIADQGGLGAVFEHLVPPELQGMLRQLIANFLTFGRVIKELSMSVGRFAIQFGIVFARALNLVMPIINSILIVLSKLVNFFATNSTALRILTQVLVTAAVAWAIFKVQALAALVMAKVAQVILGVAKVVQFLATVLLTNPIGLVITLIAAALIGAALASDRFSNAVANLFKSLTTLTGFDPDKILIPEITDQTGDIDKFNEALDGTGDSIEDLTKKAKKAQLLSFDEVFRLDDSNAEEDGLANPWGDMTFPELPEIPDYNPMTGGLMDLFGSMEASEGIFDGFAAGLKELKEAFLDLIKGSPIEKIIEGFKKLWEGITGFKWSDVVEGLGLIGTGLKELIWDPIKEAFGFHDEQGLAALMTAVILGALGLVLGGPQLALILGAIGALSSLLFSYIFNGLAKAFGKDPNEVSEEIGIGQAIGTLIGGILGTLLFGVPGGIIGMAIGNFIGGFIGIFWDEMVAIFQRGPAQAVFSAIATAIGVVLGGPIGGMIAVLLSGKIGEAVTYLVEDLFPKIATFVADTATLVADWATQTGEAFALWLSDNTKGFTEWFSLTTKGFVDWVKGTAKSVADWVSTTFPAFTNWLKSTRDGFVEWFTSNDGDLKAWVESGIEQFGVWVTDSMEMFTQWFKDSFEGFTQWAKDTEAKFTAWVATTSALVLKFVVDALSSFSTFISDSIKGFVDWADEVTKPISNWLMTTLKGFMDWSVNAARPFLDWFNKTRETLNEWTSGSWKSITNWFDVTIKGFGTWATATFDTVKKWGKDVLKNIGDFIKDFTKPLTDKLFVDIPKKFKEMFDKVVESIKNFIPDTIKKIKDWGKDIFNAIKDTVDKAVKKLKELFGMAGGSGGSSGSGGSGSSNNSSASYWRDLYDPLAGGHATGGIFNREHLAKFNEGNRAEAIIPLEIPQAMQPFVDAVANGLSASLGDVLAQNLMPILAGNNGQSQLPPIYAGTLIADDRGLRELAKKMRIVDMQENARRGLAPNGNAGSIQDW